jgi:hypothetical protein
MISNKTRKLIQKCLDDDLSRRQERHLHKILEEDPDALRLYGALRNTVDLVEELPVEEPPDHVKERVMERIELRRGARARERRPGRMEYLRRPVPRLVGAFATGGIVVGVFLMLFFRSTTESRLHSSQFANGTMGGDTVMNEELVGTLPMETGDLKGDLKVLRSGSRIVLDGHIQGVSAELPVQLTFLFSPDSLSLTGLHVPSPLAGGMETRPGFLYVTLTRELPFRLIMRKTASESVSLKVRLSRGDTELLERRYMLGPNGR